MLSWNEYLAKGVARKAETNNSLIKSLVLMTDERLKFLAKIKLEQQNASVVFTNHYDALRELSEALALLKGYKIYQHEALGLFFKEILGENVIFMKFDKFRLLRNGVNYYGRHIPFEEALQGVEDIKDTINKLKLKYLGEFT